MKSKICLLLSLIFGLAIIGCSRPAENSFDEKSSSSIPIPNDYFILDSTPQFKSFSEVAYYSYLVEKGNEFNVLKSRQRIKDKTANEKDETSDSSYVDEQGRTHYPIPIEKEYTFSNFLYFDFVSNNCEFLESRIGNGNIKGLIVQTSIFGEEMLVLKNMDKYYSCLINGASAIRNGAKKPNKRFSAHKYIEEFDVVKDNNKQTITLTFDDEIYRPLTLSTIDFEGTTFDVLPDSVFFDEQEVTCSINELRKHFGLEPDPRFEEKEYVKGQRIYDLEYDVGGYPNETMTLEEFPELTFKRDGSSAALLIEGRETVVDSNRIGAKGIYLADVNNDGYTDLAYYQNKTNGSSNNGYLVKIYDYHNDKFLFNNDNNKSSILDLDDEGVLIIEELDNRVNSSLKTLIRAGRFLAGDEISFEWFNFDFKLKGLSLEFTKYKDGVGLAYLNQKTYVMLRLYGIGSESLDKAIPIEQINVKRNDELYSFEVTNSSVASIFNIAYTFIKEGTVELEASIGDITAKEAVQILSTD